ncbi:hypothetical protein [Pandoraea cepalis]|uniref:hypothetical protein n=1 Tax=Pandoraea cepalis TaxID=2508294 RepID=UPI00263AF9C6|nr:hypothetical protein [Pandoraea cepalis]
MKTQFNQISYIASSDTDSPAAEWIVDYRADVVTTVFQKIRQTFRDVLTKDESARFLSPLMNVHSLVDECKADGYRKFFQAVDRYQVCTAGWSSEHSVAPSSRQLESAAVAVANLILAGAEPPSAMLLDDGTIGAFWRKGQNYLSIDFDSDGDLPWAGTDGERYWAGVWKPSGELPDAFRNELKSITD